MRSRLDYHYWSPRSRYWDVLAVIAEGLVTRIDLNTGQPSTSIDAEYIHEPDGHLIPHSYVHRLAKEGLVRMPISGRPSINRSGLTALAWRDAQRRQ